MPGFLIPAAGEGDGAGPVSGPGHTSEMLRKYRWTLSLYVPGVLPSQNEFVDLRVSSCDRPKVEFKEMEIHNGPDIIYRPGKLSYKPIQIKYYEAATPNSKYSATSSRFYTWWSQNIFLQQVSLYGSFVKVAATCDIILSDGKGSNIWSYRLFNCWPVSLDPDGLDYSTNEILTYSLTLRYDKYVEL
jgi:hypothetical protein